MIWKHIAGTKSSGTQYFLKINGDGTEDIFSDTLSAPREWYLTPGLWELKGISFWWAFLFETPFALMRGIGWLIPIAAMLICVGFAMKSRSLYRSDSQSKAE